jgi:hypothetical protein
VKGDRQMNVLLAALDPRETADGVADENKVA